MVFDGLSMNCSRAKGWGRTSKQNRKHGEARRSQNPQQAKCKQDKQGEWCVLRLVIYWQL